MNTELSHYIPVADMIAKTFGVNCEVVLHDLTTPQQSVVYTANNQVTGREIGQSFNHLITHVLLSKNFKDDVSANYFFKTPDGRVIRSSTALIKGKDESVIGALCVNMDATMDIVLLQRLQNQLSDIPNLDEMQAPGGEYDALPAENISDIANRLIDQIIGEKDPGKMTRDEKIAIIRFMKDKGLFLMKGSIERVADKLTVSKATIYSYLDELKEE